MITGEVYNARTGTPLDGVTVQVLGINEPTFNQTPLTRNSGEDGRFRLPREPGTVELSISKPGFMPAYRVVEVLAGKRTNPFDARLTPLDSNGRIIPAAAGGTVTNEAGDASLMIPAFALETDQDIHVTRIDAQSLVAHLPRGWSPVATVDVTPHDLTLSGAATLSIATPDALAENASLVIAGWDDVQHQWIALGTTTGAQLELDITRGGQYTFLKADTSPYEPPVPSSGEAIAGSTPAGLTADVDVTLSPSPRILFSQSGEGARVGVQAAADTAMQSGTPFQIERDEAFTFAADTHLYLPPRMHDYVLYAYPAGAQTLQSNFETRPSRTFAHHALQFGVIDLGAHISTTIGTPYGAVLTSEGGLVSAAGGESLRVPPGATATELPVSLSPLPENQFPISVTNGISFLSGVTVDLHGASLEAPAQLSVPGPASISEQDEQNLLLVQVVEVAEVSYLRLVAAARVQNGTLTSTTDPLGDGSVSLPGIRNGGRYAFVQAGASLGYISGQAAHEDGSPLVGGLISVDTFPIVATTDDAGNYALVAPVGDVEVTAMDPTTLDALTRSGTVGENGVLTLELSLAPLPPSVLAVTPADVAVDVSRLATVGITMSEAISPTSVTTQSVELAGPNGPVPASRSLSPNGRVVTLRPDARLASASAYTLTVTTALSDLTGEQMQTPFTSTFTTVDETPPPPPPAGSVIAAIPDADGISVVTGTQGLAEPGWTVVIKNLTTGDLTTVLPESDGSFTANVPAGIVDKLQLILRDEVGNETIVDIGPFRGPDGTVVIGSEGGRVEGDGGVAVEIPPDALPDGTLVKVEPLTANDFALDAPTEYPFVSGVNLDLNGTIPEKELDLSVPAPADAHEDDQVIAARQVEGNGQQGWMPIDRAYLQEDGAYETASPPFPSVISEGEYAFLRADGDCVSYVAVNFAIEYDPLVLVSPATPFLLTSDVFESEINNVVFPAVCNQEMDIEVRTANTDDLIRQMTRQAPASRDTIDFGSGDGSLITEDTTPPAIVQHNLYDGYQIDHIFLRFSEPLDTATVLPNMRVVDKRTGDTVSGEIEFQDSDSALTFRPDAALQMGHHYQVLLTGATDQAGNPLETTKLDVALFEPQALSDLEQFFTQHKGIEDGIAGTQAATSIGDDLFVAYQDPQTQRQRLLSLDTRTPDTPIQLGDVDTGLYRLRAMAPIEDVILTLDNPPDGQERLFAENAFTVMISTTEIISGLNSSEILPVLRTEFTEKHESLSQQAGVSVRVPDAQWFIHDGDDRYFIREEGGRLQVYTGRDLLVLIGTTEQPTEANDGKLTELLEIYDVTECTQRTKPAPDAAPVDPFRDCFENFSDMVVGRKWLLDPRNRLPTQFQDRVPNEVGVPMRLAVLHQDDTAPASDPVDDTAAVYVVSAGVGLQSVDISRSFNSDNPSDSPEPHGLLRGRFTDVAVLKNRVLATENPLDGGTPRLTMLTASLSDTQTVDSQTIELPKFEFPDAGVFGVTTAPDMLYDLDDDGNSGLAEEDDDDDVGAVDEIHDLALVTSDIIAPEGTGELYVLDLSAWTSLDHGERTFSEDALVSRIELPGHGRSVRVRTDERVAYVEMSGVGLGIVPLRHLAPALETPQSFEASIELGPQDDNQDGRDDRLVGVYHMPALAPRGKIAVDDAGTRPLAYGNEFNAGVELVQFCNPCPDLILDFQTEETFDTQGAGTQADVSDLARELEREREIVSQLITDTVNHLRGTAIDEDTPLVLLEQGSGSCLWRDDFEKGDDSTQIEVCSAFQPGRSDHDVEVFVPSNKVEDVQEQIDAFLDDDPEGLDQLEDLSLFAMPLEPFEDARLLTVPSFNEVGDTAGDMGLGRQNLMVLWLLTGEYVDGFEGSSLDTLLEKMQNDNGGSPFMPGEPTGIPRLEGYEWGLLQEYNLYKTGARLRIDGACDFGAPDRAGQDHVADPKETDVYDVTDPARNFQEYEALNKDCDDQLHTVAKAAIRAVFALLVSDAQTNQLVQGRAKEEDPATGLPTTDDDGNVVEVELTRANYRSNYCLTGVDDPLNPPSDPWAYEEKPCEGFEEFIATMAIDSVRRGYTITTASELPLIVKFWCVKVGDGCRKNGQPAQPIRTDEEANRFIADAIQFIEKVQERTAPIYDQTIAADDTPIEDLAPSFPFIEKVRETCTSEPVGIAAIEERDDLRRCNARVIDLKINGEDPSAGQQQYFANRHLVSAKTADKREVKKVLGVKNVVPINFQVRARNVSPMELYDVDIGMYESAGEQEANYGEPVTTYAINTLLADEKRVIDAYTETDASGEEKKVEIFPTLVSISDTLAALNGDADGSRAMAFFIDPDQEYVEIDKHNNQAGFHYYVLDAGGEPTQSESSDALPFLLKPEDIEPNAVCRAYSALDLTFAIQGEGAENNFGDNVLTSDVYKSVGYTYVLYNRGDEPLHDIEVVRNGRVVARADSLAPGERTLQTEEFVPAQAQVYRPTAMATARDTDGNTVGPARDSATLYAREGGEYTIRYYDDSALSDPTHPFSRHLLHLNKDTAKDEPIVGAVTDGDQDGNGGRIQVEIAGIEDTDTPMTVALEDFDMPGVIEGVGWLEYEKDGQVIRDVIIEDIDPSLLGTVTLYYVPPPAFVRDNYREEDLFDDDGTARVERKVRLRAYQVGAGSATQPIRLRRPPVFLVHGLQGTPDVWDEFQPFVPASGVAGGHTFVKSADGRFDVHAAGSIFTDQPVRIESAQELKGDLSNALYDYLEGYSIGRVDVVANSMGGLITRELARQFDEELQLPRPFRKLITIGTPHLGSPLADKVVETRDKLPLKSGFEGADVLKISRSTFAEYLEEGDGASMENLLKESIKVEWCAVALKAAGMTPRYNIYGGAVDDLTVNSPIQQELNSAGVLIPSHYLTGETIARINSLGVPVLAESGELQTLWTGLGVMCNWTPDSSTVDTTKTIRATAEAGKMLMPLMKLAKLKSATRVEGLMDILTGGGVDMMINELFGKDPEPILPNGNDRVVSLTSQAGALSGSTLTRVGDHTDHLDIKESDNAMATVEFCNSYLRDVFLSLDGHPRTTLDDKNLVPCQIMALLELSPESNSFYADNSSAHAPTKSAMASPLTLKPARAGMPASSDSSSAGTTSAPEPNVTVQNASLELNVVAPAPGSVVQAGGTVQVQVEPPTGVTLEELALVTSDSFTQTVDGALQGTAQIPESAVGPEFIVAYGVSTDGDVLIDYVEVIADPGQLVNLSVAAPARMTTRGAVEQLRVTGGFDDGVTRDLTRPDAGTSYESTNDSVLKVAPSGLVQAVGDGSASILVTNRHPVNGSVRLTDVPIEVDITESVTNQIPVAVASGPVTVTTEMTVTLSAAGSYDPDGDSLTYDWEQTGGRYVVLRDTDTITPTFRSPLVAETDVLTFQVTVSDDQGATTLPAEVEVTVQP